MKLKKNETIINGRVHVRRKKAGKYIWVDKAIIRWSKRRRKMLATKVVESFETKEKSLEDMIDEARKYI